MSKRVFERIVTQLKRYQKILSQAKDRDISEANTAAIIRDILSDVFGYEKFSEVTSEFAIKGTRVDLAVKVEGAVRFLIEIKAIGVGLKDEHVKQAIDYGANEGIEWVILTNGILWRIYKIRFSQPIDKTLIVEIDLLRDNPRDAQVMECFWNLSREGFAPSAMKVFCQQQQATNKFSLAALLLTDPLIKALRKELRNRFPKIKVHEDLLYRVLHDDVLKREVVDSDEAREAAQHLKKQGLKASQKAQGNAPPASGDSTSSPVAPATPASQIAQLAMGKSSSQDSG